MKIICEQTQIANIMHLTREGTQIPKGCNWQLGVRYTHINATIWIEVQMFSYDSR